MVSKKYLCVNAYKYFSLRMQHSCSSLEFSHAYQISLPTVTAIAYLLSGFAHFRLNRHIWKILYYRTIQNMYQLFNNDKLLI